MKRRFGSSLAGGRAEHAVRGRARAAGRSRPVRQTPVHVRGGVGGAARAFRGRPHERHASPAPRGTCARWRGLEGGAGTEPGPRALSRARAPSTRRPRAARPGFAQWRLAAHAPTGAAAISAAPKGRGNDLPGVAGTLWAAYNGIAEMIDHGQSRRTPDQHLEHIWFGNGHVLKVRAFQVAGALRADAELSASAPPAFRLLPAQRKCGAARWRDLVNGAGTEPARRAGFPANEGGATREAAVSDRASRPEARSHHGWKAPRVAGMVCRGHSVLAGRCRR